MTWVAVAIGGAAVVGAVASNSAASKQANAQTNAANMQQGQWQAINQQEQPFMQAGYGATSSLQNLMGSGTAGGTDPSTGLPNEYLTQTFNPTQDQLNNYPGYQFALKTGGQAVQNASTPSAGALSGQTLKSLMNFNQQAANTNYGQYFNQFQTQQNNIYSRLSGIAGLGQNAASNTGTAGTQLGIGAAQATAAAGSSLAGGIVGVGNSLGNASVPLAYMMQNPSTGGGSSYNTDPYSYGAQNGSDVNTTIFSDRRLKTNIVRIGTTARGNALYSWDWKTGGSSQGVIAQEVRHIPGAVHEDADGILMVDYTRV